MEPPIEIVEEQVWESKNMDDLEQIDEEEYGDKEGIFDDDSQDEDIEHPSQTMDFLQIDMTTKIEGIVSRSDRSDYIVTLPKLVYIFANTDFIIYVTLPNVMNNLFFNP